MQIKLPKSINELRQRHIDAMSKVDLKSITVMDRATLCSSFTGIDIATVKRMAFDDVMSILEHYFILIGTYKQKDLAKQIEVNGNSYTLIKSPEKMPTDWHIDMSGFEMSDPAIIAAFYYIETGMDYCQMDKHSNILNPVSQRADIFREHLPANILIDLRFFLQKKLDSFKKNSMENPKEQKKASHLFTIGKTRLTLLQKN